MVDMLGVDQKQVGGIVNEQRNYETFKEFPGGRGVAQNIFTTIEFGLSPFLPMSEQYIMDYGDLPKRGFGMHASDFGKMTPEGGWQTALIPGMKEKEATWGGRIQEYGVVPGKAGRSVTQDLKNTPDSQIKAQAERLSQRISDLLEMEGITSDFDSTVRGEVEEQAISRMLRNDFPMGAGGPWESPSYKSQVEVPTRKLLKLGGETFDMWPENQNQLEILDYNLNFLARQLGDDFVKGVSAMETTNMTKSKYFIQKARESDEWKAGTQDWSTTSQAEAWNDGVIAAVHELMEMQRKSSSGFVSIYNSIVNNPNLMDKEKDGSETVSYFAKQTLSRFAEIQAGQFGEAYIFQAPISKYESGYARLQPVFGSGPRAEFLEDIRVQTGVIGRGAFMELIEGGGGKDVFQQVGSQKSWSSHAQLLVMDAAIREELNLQQMLGIMAPISQQAANELAIKSGYRDLLGSSLPIEVGVSLGNVISSAGTVQAVEIIGSRTAGQMVQNQIEAFFLNPQMQGQMERFYREAMSASQDVTTLWRSNRGGGNYTVKGNSTAGIWSNAGGPFTDERNLEGMGIPFWFLIGRDATGFEKFTSKETHSIGKMAGIIPGGKVAEAKKWQQYIDEGIDPDTGLPFGRPDKAIRTPGVYMKGEGSLKGRHMAVRDPRSSYITKTFGAMMGAQYGGGRDESIQDVYERDREGKMINIEWELENAGM